jgi:hypothetical protein
MFKYIQQVNVIGVSTMGNSGLAVDAVVVAVIVAVVGAVDVIVV